MNLDIVGGAYTLPSLPLDAQTCHNMYLIQDKNYNDKDPDANIRAMALIDRPGLTLFANSGGAQVRGIFENFGNCYVVVDNTFYTMTSAGVLSAAIGNLTTTTGPINFVANISGTSPNQIGFCDGTNMYVYCISNQNNNTLTQASTETVNAAGTSVTVASVGDVFTGANIAITCNDSTIFNGTVTSTIGATNTINFTPGLTAGKTANSGNSLTTQNMYVANNVYLVNNNISYIDMQNVTALGAVLNADQWTSSNPSDFTTWPPLNVASVTNKAEPILAVKAFKQEAWVFTNKYVEVWDVDPTQVNLFYSRRTDPVAILYGCAAPNSIVQTDNTLYWLAKDEGGQSLIVRNEWYNTKIISNEAISSILSNNIVSDAVGYPLTLNGHVFYVLTLPTIDRTLVYDCSTNYWFEWKSYRNQTGLNANLPQVWGRFLGWCHAFAFGKHLVGDFNSGNVYVLDPTNYTDNGTPLLRERTTKHFIKGLKRRGIKNLQIDFETGTALVTGQGSNPQVMLQISKDGGRSWGIEKWVSSGLIGQYLWRARWLSLGFARDWTFRIRFSEPCAFRILGAVADIEEGDV